MTASDPSVRVYEEKAKEWQRKRSPAFEDRCDLFAKRIADLITEGQEDGSFTEMLADLGCGPGWHTRRLPEGTLAYDASLAMLALAEGAPRIAGDLRALPFRRGSLLGAWASRSYVHLPRSDVPLALADLHAALKFGAIVELHLFEGDEEHSESRNDDFPGRRFSRWPLQLLRDVLAGAGFDTENIEMSESVLLVSARRAHTLADTVGSGMRLLVCGLNPSLHSAEVGIGFASAGNRFWPAAIAAGVLSVDRDPRHALREHGVGMTDLVKRPSRRAGEIAASEFKRGLRRLETLVNWLKPAVVCFVGLTGWRTAVDQRAAPGVQRRRIGGRPVYLMPSTSGLNARCSLEELTDHLHRALESSAAHSAR